MKLFVSNFPFSTTEQELRAVFEEIGQVESVKVLKDRDTGRPKGFGFVEMASVTDGQAAIDRLDGLTFGGRPLRVAPARDKDSRPGDGKHHRRDRAPREARW